MTARGERFFGLLLRMYPRAFHEHYRAELLAFFRQDRLHPKYGAGPIRPLRFWAATIIDAVRTAVSQRRARSSHRQPSNSGAGRWSRDSRFAWRALRAAPGVTLAAIAVLAIGIGASTTIFSVVDAVVLRGLPYPDDDRLVVLTERIGAKGRGPVRPQTYREWVNRQRVFDGIGAAAGVWLQPTMEEPVETLRAARITASLVHVLGGAPARGRALAETDEHPGARPVAVISDRLWRTRFAADPGAIGRTMTFKTGAVQIVGIMPATFRYPVSTSADLWLPFVPTPQQTARNSNSYSLLVIGRLAPGVSLEAATAQMTAVSDGLAAEDARWFGDHGVLMRSWRDSMLDAPVRSWLLLLLSAVAGVLLIACLNVANLLVARAVTRGPELAVRTALGASRWDLARALLIESLMLSLIGAAGGVLLAIWGVEILRTNLPGNVPRLATVALDLRVIIVAVASAIATGLAFGTLPALQGSRIDLVTLAAQGGRSHSGGRAGRRLRMGLVISEVAIASVLLVGSGMFLASFVRVTSIELGFDPTRVIALTGGMASSRGVRPPATADDRAQSASAQTKLMSALEGLRAVPGVVSVAALGGGRPLGGTTLTVPLRPLDAPTGVQSDAVEPFTRSVTAGYLDVLRGTLVRGRWIADSDAAGAERVIVLSDETARQYFGARDPIGQRVQLGNDPSDGPPLTVIGIVRSMRFSGPERDIRPEVFVPLLQGSHTSAEILVRTQPEPISIVPALHAAIRPHVQAETLLASPMEQDYARLIAQRKFNMVILALFGIVAILVAALGIYGLMAFVVEQRRREIGVRVALGAEPAGILTMVLRSAAALMVAGLVVGIAAAAGLERLVRAFLFEPQPHEPIVYAGAALVLFVTGLIAAFGPARRAARVDPLVALRTE